MTTYSPLGAASVTALLCTNQAMRNVELVQSCTEPNRLCECITRDRVVHRSTPGRERLKGRYSQLTEKKAQNRTEDIKVPQVSYNPSSSPRGPISSSLLMRCASTQPYAAIRPLWSGLEQKAMRPVDSQHKKFHPCLGHASHVHSADAVR